MPKKLEEIMENNREETGSGIDFTIGAYCMFKELEPLIAHLKTVSEHFCDKDSLVCCDGCMAIDILKKVGIE